MITQTCTLKFPDGAVVTAVVEAASPESENPIRYEGAVDRLPHRYDTGGPSDIEFLFRKFAEELGAEYSSDMSGTYDRWAE